MRAKEIQEWPYGFLHDFWSAIDPAGKFHEMTVYDSAEIIQSIKYVLAHTKIPARELEMVQMRYEWLLPYAEIGKYYSITGGRVAQILAHTMRRIKAKEDNCRILANGITEFLDQKREDEREGKIEILDVSSPVEKLELPVRAYHCLTRSGLLTVGDVLALKDRSQLLRMRNAGEQTCDIIVNALEEKGFDAARLKRKPWEENHDD